MTTALAAYLKVDRVGGDLASIYPQLTEFDSHGKVFQWIEFANREWPRLTVHGLYPALEFLNSHLLSRVYIADSQFSAADALVFDLVSEAFKTLSKEDRSKYCALTRWFDFVQHSPELHGKVAYVPIQQIVEYVPRSFDLVVLEQPKETTVAATAEAKIEEKKPKKKEQTTSEGTPATPANVVEPKEAKETKGGKEAKKPKEPKAPKEVAPAAPPAKEEEDILSDLSKLDFRVAFIKKAWKHPEADSLYVEEVDLSEKAPRTVVSGLVGKVPLEELQGRLVVVLANLKPAALKGIKSEAMVLAATGSDGKVELLTPPKDAKVGERVSFDGVVGEPEPVLNPKKRCWEKVQPLLRTGENLVAYFKDLPFTTSAGPCTVQSVSGATIR